MDNNIVKIVNSGLCTSCGVCSAICNQNAIIFKNSTKPFVCIEQCKNCGLCLQVCPGQGVDLIHEASLIYNDAQQNNLCGRYLSGYVGYSNNKKIRFASSSGGLITQFLLYLLDNNIINGAIVTGFNNEIKKPYSFLATTKDEIIRIFNLDYEGNSYQTISNLYNKEKVYGKTNWCDGTIQKII